MPWHAVYISYDDREIRRGTWLTVQRINLIPNEDESKILWTPIRFR